MSILIIVAVLVVATVLFMQGTQFGSQPKGERLKRVEKSPNYKEGKFQNLSVTPDLAEGVSYYTVMKEFFFNKDKRNAPKDTLPSKKTDLLHLDPKENIIVWFGHSSYFMQVDGKKILVDPVFSGHASPLSFTTKSFAGSDVYTVDDFPEIDYLFISHDHWDHLDYKTILQLKPKVKKVVTGLGTGEHFERWGYNMAIVKEGDWYDSFTLDDGFTATVTPARHFSGRSFTRNKAIWASFVLQTPTMNIFLGGDSGYDYHFKEIGRKFGPFDLAILECGQYNEYWKYIHMMPEEVVKAAQDLNAEKLMPVHWAKFSLGLHPWDESIIRVTAEAKKQNMPVVTPMIGEKANLNSNDAFPEWWRGLE